MLFCILMNNSIDAGGLAPYTTYSLCLVDGDIRLQCTPDHASAIPDDIKEQVLKETELPDGLEIDMTESASWILMELEVEAPELYAEIEKEALAPTMTDFAMDLDLTDLLKGTPDLPLYP